MRLVLIFSCLLFGFTSSLAVAGQGAPKLVCDQPTYDFGKMDDSMEVTHIFVLKNAGDLPLEIKQVSPSQGVTVTGAPKKTVAPDGETRVSAQLSLRGRSGPQQKTITIESNDPDQPDFTLALNGTVVTAGLEVNPKELEFGNLKTGSAVTKIVEVAQYSAKSFKIGKVESNNRSVTARSEVVKEGKAYRIVVSTQPPLAKGALRGSVRVQVDDPSCPSINILVSGQVTEN